MQDFQSISCQSCWFGCLLCASMECPITPKHLKTIAVCAQEPSYVIPFSLPSLLRRMKPTLYMCCSQCSACWSHLQCDSTQAANILSYPPTVLPAEGSRFPHLPWNLKRIEECFYQVWLPLSLSASSLHHPHSSCVPERSARLISTRLCVSCRVSPKALLAPLAQAVVRFQTGWADGFLPNQSVLLSLISIFQTSIYFPRPPRTHTLPN